VNFVGAWSLMIGIFYTSLKNAQTNADRREFIRIRSFYTFNLGDFPLKRASLFWFGYASGSRATQNSEKFRNQRALHHRGFED
jgi:hypothetical protein